MPNTRKSAGFPAELDKNLLVVYLGSVRYDWEESIRRNISTSPDHVFPANINMLSTQEHCRGIVELVEREQYCVIHAANFFDEIDCLSNRILNLVADDFILGRETYKTRKKNRLTFSKI